MDTDWCAYCQKHLENGKLYCSEECEQKDLSQVQADEFDFKQYSHQLNDMIEAREIRFLKPSDEVIPKLSEIRAHKTNASAGFSGLPEPKIDLPKPSQATASAELPEEEKKRRELDETKAFLRSYQRRRVWSTESLKKLAQPTRARSHQPESEFLSKSVSTTELDPSMFLKPTIYTYEPRRFERDRKYADQLMQQPWFASESSVH